MTEPNETNEELNEELSTDELKSVSGGITEILPILTELVATTGAGGQRTNPHGSGSGMTRVDFERANKNTEGSFTITEVGQP